MTLTRKIGFLLLLLTAGALAGTVGFAFFVARSAAGGVYIVAAQLENSMLQQIEIDTLEIREGQQDVRPLQRKLLQNFDILVASMQNGGQHPARADALLVQIVGSALDIRNDETIRAIQEGLPAPPPDLRQRISGIQSLWLEVKEPLRVIVEKPADDPDARAAYDKIKPRMDELLLASRLILVTTANRITVTRERLLAMFAAVGMLSLTLFFFGLWFTNRYISRPIEMVEKAAREISAGNYSQRVPVLASDELASLAMAMNEMGKAVEVAVEQYREIFENAGDIIYTMDLDGKFLSVNRAAERILGYSRDEFLKLNVAEIVAPDQLEISNQMMQKKLSGEQTVTTYTLQVLHKTGQAVWLEVGTRLIYENGKATAVQGTARDVSERRRLEEQLWTARKMEAVGRLAGGIAHEFGNVLTIITGYAALLKSGLKKDDELYDEVEGIQKAAQRATSLIRHLLGFSKGQLFRPKTLDVCAALNDVGDMLRRLIGEDVRLRIACGPNLGYIRFDPAQLEQVLVNLALNARDAMASGGEFTVAAENVDLSESVKNGNDEVGAGPYIRFRVSDTGAGIASDVLPKIFEPFFSTKERGTGLGLSTVYGIVHQSGGSIAADSTVGHGTTFTIYLPRVVSLTERASPEEQARPARPGTETILLVEDNEDVRLMVCEMLRTQGYNVIAALDQQQAISICSQKERRIDLMLTDVVMPEMSGPELAAQIRPLRPALRILYMSGYAQDKFEAYARNREPFEFIQKPLTPEALAIKVREVLDAPLNGAHG
ncbi:MAG TPA: PAS domain S-box protein [Terriglobia bacterium]|nr:PAS domain S-box protein [Terriglobia bacterium]